MSLLNKYPCVNISAPTYLSFTTATLSILSGVVASIGNFLVVLAVFLNPNRDLRSPFHFFVVSLGFADLVVGLLTCPLTAIFHIAEGMKRANQQLRVWMHISFFISCTASLLSLTALTLDRYVAITYPLHYRAKLSPFRAFVVSVVVWIIAVLLSMIYFAVGYNKFRFIFANTAIAVTFVVLIFTNTKIFKYLRLQVSQWDSLHDSTEENLAKKRAIKWEKKITKALIIVLLLFLACYLPSCICIYIINFCTNCNCLFIHWVRDIQFVLALANSGVNPFVYAWKLQKFRAAFKRILKCRTGLKRLRSISYNVQASTVSIDVSSSITDGHGQFNPLEISLD